MKVKMGWNDLPRCKIAKLMYRLEKQKVDNSDCRNMAGMLIAQSLVAVHTFKEILRVR